MNRPQNQFLLQALLALVCIFVSSAPSQAARPNGSEETPISFFTNISAHLLRSQLNLDLHRLQLFPTNQYTPAVHRLLQVAANIYDSTTNRTVTDYPYFPSVFRPLFTNDGGAIFITGYKEETDIGVLHATTRDLTKQTDRDALQSQDMVYGVPLVIGAKKGFPSFNELELQTAVQVTRRLQFIRTSPPFPFRFPVQTNQMYVVGISNTLGIEAWNPYTNPFPRDLRLLFAVDVSGTLTNERGSTLVSNRSSFASFVDIPSNTWSGYVSPHHSQGSFRIPLFTNFWFLTNSTYSQLLGQFVPTSAQFEKNEGLTVPRWWLQQNVGLRFALVDVSVTPNRIVDYVNLSSADPPTDITSELSAGNNCSTPYSLEPYNPGMFWCTNQASPTDATFGIRAQIDLSLGKIPQTPFAPFAFNQDALYRAIDFFRSNFAGFFPLHGYPVLQTNVFEALPASRTLYISTSWQANDPLVHYTLGDLVYAPANNRVQFDSNLSRQQLLNVGQINYRYQPWGGLGSPFPVRQILVDLALKDPLATRADDWDFPNSSPFDVASLGRIHRGTPWQILYLKSAVADPLLWSLWLGPGDAQDAQSMHPTNDWRLVSSLISLLTQENPPELLSVNETSPVRWKRVLNGLTVLTNTSDVPLLLAPVLFDSLVMHPDSPQMDLIIAAIQAARSNQPGQVWADRSDVLSTPALTVASPWLNLSNPVAAPWVINDEAYEKIPSQLLQRLRSDSIGSVVRRGQDTTIRFSGMDDSRYVIETSPDLLNWRPVSTNQACGGTIELPAPSTADQRFYRSVLLAR